MKNYIDRLKTGTTPQNKLVNLYENRAPSGVLYYVTEARQRVFETEVRAAAETFFERRLSGSEDAKREPLSLIEKCVHQANLIRNTPALPYQLPLSFHLLAGLEFLRLQDSGRTKVHMQHPLTLAKALNDLPPLPQDRNEFYLWCAEALNVIQNIKSPKTRKIAENESVKETTSRGVKGRVDTFVRCLSHINQFPALNRWKGGAEIGIAHVKGQKSLLARGKSESHSYAPFSLKEIQGALDACENFGASLLLLTYLTLGTRSGDAEKASYSHILGGKYQLDRIQSKTKTQNQPLAPIVLKALLRLKLDEGIEFDALPAELDKRRFRPTCAVGLCLSGVNTLSVAARTGHATQMMVIRHYARVTPSDYRHRDFKSYSGVGLLRIDGETVNSDENAYDSFLLKLLLDAGKRFGYLEKIKSVMKEEMGTGGASDESLVVSY